MTAVCLRNLRRCADLLHSTVTDMDTSPMTTDEMEKATDSARDIEFDVQMLLRMVESEKWSRPEYWTQFFRDDPPLYCPREAIAAIDHLRAISGLTPKPWQGYLYTLKGDTAPYVIRMFDCEVRDVVPAGEAHTAPCNADTIFDDIAIVEKPARQLEMTVYRYLTTQTSEQRYAAVALCFV